MTDPREDIARRMAQHMQAQLDAATRDAICGLSGRGTFSFTANDHDRPPLTHERLRKSIHRAQHEIGLAPPPLKIQESEQATEDGGPVRTYPKRKAKSLSHWRRMNKKWLKRYGVKRVPCMYKLDTSYITGKPGITLLVHPTLAPKLYEAIAKGPQ